MWSEGTVCLPSATVKSCHISMRLSKKLPAGGRWRRRASLTWLQKRSTMKACGYSKAPAFCLLSGGSCTIQKYTRIEIPSNPSGFFFFHLAMSQIAILRPSGMDVGDARDDSSRMPDFASISHRGWLLSVSAKRWTRKEIEFDVKPGPGVLTYVGTFPLQLKPRSASHADTVRQMEKRFSRDSSGDAALL